MDDREKVVKGLERCLSFDPSCGGCPYYSCDDMYNECERNLKNDILAILKEQEKKEIKLHKKHVLTLKRNDEFTMRKLYESICEKLLDEGEMIITRTDDHEKIEFVFYVAGE